MSSSTPPRRFAPEHIEHSTKSSRQPGQKEEPAKKPRRFVPELVEESAKSSKDANQQQNESESAPKPRRFAPEVIEEGQTSSKDRPRDAKKGHVKFLPEPISTEYGSNRKPKRSLGSDTSSTMEMDDPEPTPRKFTPILLDTARRSRRAGDSKPAISQSDKTEYAYHLHQNEHWQRMKEQRSGPVTSSSPMSTDDHAVDSDQASMIANDQSPQLRDLSPLDGSTPKRASCLAPDRRHSFRMPDLDTIDSSQSERDSNPSPLSSTPPERDGSPITASDSSYDHFNHATRIRESIDENFTHYLLDLERKKAKERLELEEQVLAAYPNPGFGYEAPDHYMIGDNESDDVEIEDRPVTFEAHEEDELPARPLPRRDSTGVPYEQLEMQRHAEELQQERNANRITAKASSPEPESPSPWWRPRFTDRMDISTELKSMQDRARPPMLGGSIVFPRCPSPEPARFDVTQSSAVLRKQMCYLSETAEAGRKDSGEEGGLWQSSSSAQSPVTVRSPSGAFRSPLVSANVSQTKGLWGGFCVDEGEEGNTAGGLAPPLGPTGLMTPRVEGPNPFEHIVHEERLPAIKIPPTPPHPNKAADHAQIEAVLAAEQDLEEAMQREFSDSFVTQVYNYLSLGYPSLARPFDEELAKITGYSIAELRQDDIKARASPRGYIRLGSDFEGGGGEGLTEDKCMRWQALKLYVREWARQERGMVKGGQDGNWGTGARRGSWAF